MVIKVLHINTSGVGGAAIACHRLHDLMQSAGIQSEVLHMYDNCSEDEHYHVLGYKVIRKVLNHAVYTITQKDLTPDAYVFNEMAPLRSGVVNHPLVKQADVIFLHWVLGGLMSKGDFEDLARTGKPIFCFTHDMWWITGGCHYAFDCEGYKTGCKKCPKHKHASILTSSQSAWKRKFYGNYFNVQFISPSDWLRKCADSSSAVGQGRCTFIPNIVPDKIFKYNDKQQARERFGLPKDKVIVAFGTADNSNVIKGMKYLVEALKMISDDRILLCVYGSARDENLEYEVPQPIRFLGRFTDPKDVAMANAAADVFVSPTLAESFGQTLLESIKCGTPVISTKTTAVPEIVQDGINGYLVEPQSSNGIAAAIMKFVSNPIKLNGSYNEIFSEKSILNKHLALIEKSLNSKL